ncbi:hypothetical protein PoB_006462900 [Plakobranchus ocellatus]|uniref:Secreted protein n=1 Tax=Plakobranchus ocellatus TaxID=259542 RepID=A0AAV4D1M4_9GAST|nr:hypothetical protein PoB_006462900 [Plakobranchus ocellatus]
MRGLMLQLQLAIWMSVRSKTRLMLETKSDGESLQSRTARVSFLFVASPHQGDLRLSGPLSGQGIFAFLGHCRFQGSFNIHCATKAQRLAIVFTDFLDVCIFPWSPMDVDLSKSKQSTSGTDSLACF